MTARHRTRLRIAIDIAAVAAGASVMLAITFQHARLSLLFAWIAAVLMLAVVRHLLRETHP